MFRDLATKNVNIQLIFYSVGNFFFNVKLIIIVGHDESVYFPVLRTNAHVQRSLAAK